MPPPRRDGMSIRSPSLSRRIPRRRRRAPTAEGATPAPTYQSLPVAQAFAGLRASRVGLTEEEAALRLDVVGPNALPEGRSLGPFPLLAHQVLSPFVVVPIGAAAISTTVHHYLTAFVILMAVAVNVVLGFMQEFKAERALRSLKSLHAPKAVAYRGGVARAVLATEIVPGDLVLLEAARRAPAGEDLLHGARPQSQGPPLSPPAVADHKTPEAVHAAARPLV